VRKGGGQRAKPGLAVQHIETIPAEPVNPASGMPFVGAETNGHGVMVLGREYGLTDLERIVKHYNELRFHLKACPDCGYNLREHLKCYNIVKRHQEAARIEEEI
jgi:hypothetical protein